MALSKDKKKELLKEVQGILDDSTSVVFANFHGLTVADSTAMRKALRAVGVGFKVAKKTIVKRALDGKKVPGEMPAFAGELALGFSADTIAPSRELYTFQKKYENRLSILGGIFEGTYRSKGEIEALALIPSRETLYAQFVNIINSPIAGFVRALDAVAKKK
jgi:large subunit ribosomal protein L10